MASATSSTSYLEAKPEKIKPGEGCNFLSARKGRRPIAEVMDMKKGETAVLTSMSPLLCKDLSLSHGCLWGKGAFSGATAWLGADYSRQGSKLSRMFLVHAMSWCPFGSFGSLEVVLTLELSAFDKVKDRT